ncbi:hypothetical protein VOLCADRAFT_99610 [Volvox carteri f. nagariensis]|uniref:Uncharacterized protein n=1 Tax=Volvox carteri f. nagariensis TaxID=3068 RepID=D8UI78_VOLCA|nr:uncharacterized protein VOLCADRAFT_99610 [Volvox carteri f. nagariensis]EFJ40566.1 hypothetical protein VOLCADRAFT_99610 [Volvox carteri f. nagariensis]|eukprot:XP_002958344.1 hypothetical protein VOLCADRAFT_99610 [Volvox carteri f. nagariensis]
MTVVATACKSAVNVALHPPVPAGWVPLVHVLCMAVVFAIPWGLSYMGASFKHSNNGPITMLCDLRPVDDQLMQSIPVVGGAIFTYDYIYYNPLPSSPEEDFPTPPPLLPPPQLPPDPPPNPMRFGVKDHKPSPFRDCSPYEDVFDYSDMAEMQPLNNTAFVSIDVDVKKFVASALVNVWFGEPPELSRKAPQFENGTRRLLDPRLTLTITINNREVITIKTIGKASSALDNLPVFAERHLRMYPFDRYRLYIRASMSLAIDDNSTFRLPYVIAVTQKGSGMNYYVREPRRRYQASRVGNPALSEVLFTIWGVRTKTSRFVSIFIVLLMWLLSFIVLTRAVYTVSKRHEVSMDDAGLAATVLFALPQVRIMQPGIPPEVGLVIDMAGFIWNMVMVSVACIMYLWVMYAKAVQREQSNAAGSQTSDSQITIVVGDQDTPACAPAAAAAAADVSQPAPGSADSGGLATSSVTAPQPAPEPSSASPKPAPPTFNSGDLIGISY